MGDIADDAEKQEQLTRDYALSIRKPELRREGLCHYCQEPIAINAKNQLFCDCYCRDDYERRRR